MMKITNEQEKNQYFDKQITGEEGYFNVKYPSGKTEFIFVKKFESWNDDGSNWYLESPNQLMKYDVEGISLEPHYDEEEDETYIPFEHCYINGNTAYEINSAQTSPFLPEEFEIEFITDDETEAIKYMLQLEKKQKTI